MIEAQDGKCGCGCGQPVTMENGHGEHGLPVGLGNTGKPDSVWRADCHVGKSNTDRAMMKKADDQRRYHETGRSRKDKARKIRSRSFTGWRLFDGTVKRV